MWDVFVQCTVDPQLAHKLFSVVCVWAVHKLCIKSLLHHGNFPQIPEGGLFQLAFLPTMKLQPSQLPMIVGSGRVATRRALFLVRAVLIQSLDAFR